ncbi:Ubiquitin conjugating enzyme Ubc15 [Schizosaccharomyces pombe]|uniref:Ubiquitin-conjugating enzyme E2 15 n=1 Tax=Schizosaccharomyces pombe (strain 972 / ATCC 24843) TaxID=284812 RepID=UBC15_SCHPO|nr:ubiquitin-conjugating enzyme Ubc15 [Schizosaccharomyces pombe]Q9Y818.1 RecName: Full=Ubiquitin-conjugating enzyme E2 15; AltName: Full=E2 ubiquitin-conjugating enzyme 15; AltName: Full=Ubiquitin carrier protein 15; AltName: Full=Ubiquitin-protein ligase 15 [Schizosaccharomyces pombe 972h-]CAB50972.1 ubiquitin conjugating enzyme Ubc15 [Schizosaccharomyces pombe]|eukprot:NP_596465.1 ubiquitin-conjugating enzyme Ubc15 [Schizosaccharomyces pombe]
MPSSASEQLLRKQLKEIQKNPPQGFSVGLVDDKSIFEWEVMIIGPEDTLYEGGFFHATLSFPQDYPLMPPKMKFTTEIWHPNVHPNGEVCISILHPPGDDKYGYEDAGERWLPVHSPETILISVISMLSSPNDESPANIDAAKEFRENPQEFKKRVRRLVRRSIEMI